jgi:lipopolysaccharide transport system permease protein
MKELLRMSDAGAATLGTGWFAELIRYRELLYFFAWRDVKVRYKQAALGAAWAIIQPFTTMFVFTIFFGRLAGVPSDGVPYSIFSFCGLVAWMYFSSVLSQAGNSLISNSNLVTKVYFPRILLPASTAVGGLLDLLIASSMLVAMMIYYKVPATWGLLAAPLFIGLMVLLVLGLGMFLAAMNVRYRDIKYVIPFALQLGLFVTPIIYPITFVPESFRYLLALNPMAGIVGGLRASVLGTAMPSAYVIGMSCGISLLVFVVGLVYFRRVEREFADVV